jgi:hypothetical protein
MEFRRQCWRRRRRPPPLIVVRLALGENPTHGHSAGRLPTAARTYSSRQSRGPHLATNEVANVICQSPKFDGDADGRRCEGRAVRPFILRDECRRRRDSYCKSSTSKIGHVRTRHRKNLTHASTNKAEAECHRERKINKTKTPRLDNVSHDRLLTRFAIRSIVLQY